MSSKGPGGRRGPPHTHQEGEIEYSGIKDKDEMLIVVLKGEEDGRAE